MLNISSTKTYLPNNFLIEKILLSTLLLSSEAIDLTIKNLPIEAFYFSNHQEIYKAIIKMHNSQYSIDIFTLHTFLKEQGLLKKIGGFQVLIELTDQIPTLSSLNDYIGIIKDKFLRRCLIKLGYSLINSSYVSNISLESILTESETKLFNITSNNQNLTKSCSHISELFEKIVFDLQKKSTNEFSSALKSGFSKLDNITQGFQNADLIIIAGRPSTGKTAFALNIALNIVNQTRVPILFFSLEMSKEQLVYRLLSIETEINQTCLKTGQLNKFNWKKLVHVMKNLSEIPFFIDDISNSTFSDIRLKLKKISFEQGSIGLLIIDYLQLLELSNFKTENRVQELSQITRNLKMLAKEFNIPIIALSQLSRNIETRFDKRPILSDLRESGSIEQDADLVLMLYKENILSENAIKYPIDISIAKHRNGPIGKVRLYFNSSLTKFIDKL